LNNTDIVCSTVVTSGKRAFDSFKPDVLIIDEAGQTS
jgi:superfamily I DNA and/or RNA helicase